MPFIPWPEDLDLSKQAVEIPGSRKEGYSGVWINGPFPVETIFKDQPRTLYEVFERSLERNGPKPLFLSRPLLVPGSPTAPAVYSPSLVSMTYEEAGRRRHLIGKAVRLLAREGKLASRKSMSEASGGSAASKLTGGPTAQPENIEGGGFGVGIWSANRPEWQLVDLACHAYGMVGVPLYDTLGPTVVEYVVEHAPLSIVFVSGTNVLSLLKVASKCPSLRTIVSMDEFTPKELTVLSSWSSQLGIQFFTLTQLESLGASSAAAHIPIQPPSPETVATISYTSGTTGNPKGVVLSHGNVTSGAISQSIGAKVVEGGEVPRLISYLPLAHILERFFEILFIHCDGEIGYTTGNPLLLLEDAQIIKPNIFPAVPRVLNRIHQAIMGQVAAGGLKGNLLGRALKTKLEAYRATGEVNHALYDRLVFKKVRALLGGNVKYMTSGSAPLSPVVMETLRVALSIDMVEGYGLTETVGVTTSGISRDPGHMGNTGPPRCGVQVRVRDVKEMSYLSTDRPDPRGELQIRGPVVFQRYHKNKKATDEVLDAERWFSTGDIASIDSYGRVKIVDRIKNVMKLSQGEYVALERLENCYNLHPLFAAILVHGDSFRSHVIMVGIVDPVQAAGYINKCLGTNLLPTETEKIRGHLTDKKLRRQIVQELKAMAKKEGLNGFEMIRSVHLELDPFPEDILTPTLKVKRAAAAKHYKAAIDAAYEEEDTLFVDEVRAKL